MDGAPPTNLNPCSKFLIKPFTHANIYVHGKSTVAQQSQHRAWNNVPKVPDHGDRQSWFSLLFSGWKPCFSADHKQFLADLFQALQHLVFSSAFIYCLVGVDLMTLGYNILKFRRGYSSFHWTINKTYNIYVSLANNFITPHDNPDPNSGRMLTILGHFFPGRETSAYTPDYPLPGSNPEMAHARRVPQPLDYRGSAWNQLEIIWCHFSRFKERGIAIRCPNAGKCPVATPDILLKIFGKNSQEIFLRLAGYFCPATYVLHPGMPYNLLIV
jgi:hypothetical protein